MGHQVTTKVQVLDAGGDPATGANVSYIIRKWDGTVIDSGSMSHEANGIYTVSWVPEDSGHYTVETYSSNPKFRRTFPYLVHEKGIASIYPSNGSLNLYNNTDEQTIWEVYTHDWTTSYNYSATLWIDLSNLSEAVIIRQYVAVDEAGGGSGNYRLYKRFDYPDDFPDGEEAICLIFPVMGMAPSCKVTMQSVVAQGVLVSLPFCGVFDRGEFHDFWYDEE